MIYLGVLCLAACALAQPAVYISRTTYDEYSRAWYYPLDAPMVALAPEKEGAELEKEMVIPIIPDSGMWSSLPWSKSMVLDLPKGAKEIRIPEGVVILEDSEHKDEERKEEDLEEHKEEELEEQKEEVDKEEELKEEEIVVEAKEEEERKEEVKVEELKPVEIVGEVPKPVIVKLKPPQFVTDFIQSLPITFPNIKFPILGSLFGKPKLEALEPMPAPLPGTAPIDMMLHRYRVAYVPVVKDPIELVKK